ncbi:MAG TPA: CBS domain-containing protein [Pyrinomonadaceae bacterium]|nr:CBS domain-containing protein [Pyrinomonadaceae bacterium]
MNNSGSESKSRVRCSEIMTKNVSTVTPEMSLYDVAKRMKEGDIGVLPVVEESTGKLVGIITDRDIVVRVVAEEKLVRETLVKEVMTRDVFTAKPDDFAFTAARIMGEKQVRRVPIVDDEGVLHGIVSIADIALEMEDQLEVAETLEEISSGKAFWSK